VIDAALRALARAVTERRGAVLVCTALLTVTALALLPRLSFEPDVRTLLDEEGAPGADAERARTTAVLLGPTDGLEPRLAGLVASVEASPHVEGAIATRAAWLERMDAGSVLPLCDEQQLAALEERLSPEGLRAALEEESALLADPLAGRETFRADPLGLRWLLEDLAPLPPGLDPASPWLLSADGRSALVLVVGREPPFEVEASVALLEDLERRLAEVPARYVGGHAIARADAGRIRRDLVVSSLTSIPLVLAFLALSWRSARAALLCVAPVSLAVLWTMGLGGAALSPLTPLAAGAAAILTGLGVDFTLHWLGPYAAARSRSGHADATLTSHLTAGRALLGAAVTSAAAFLGVATGAMAGLARFGALLAVGLGFALFAALVVLPALTARAKLPAGASRPATVARVLAALVQRPVGRLLALALPLLGVLGAALAAERGVPFDSDPGRLRPADDPLAQGLAALEGELGLSPFPARAAPPPGTAPGTVAAGVRKLEQSGAVAWSGPVPHQTGEPGRARLATFAERTAGWPDEAGRALAERGFDPIAFEPALRRFEGMLDAAAPVPDATVLLLFPPRALDTTERRDAFRSDVQSALGEDAWIEVPFGMADHLGPALGGDLRRALLRVGVAVLLLAWLITGSPGRALLALVPVLTGLGVLCGALALLGIPVHPGNLAALPLILGIGVDDGLHVVLARRRGGDDTDLAVASGVWRTTATTSLGFGSLILAATPALSALGAMVLAGVLLCWLASALTLPALLDRRRA
jgi:predicted exporter